MLPGVDHNRLVGFVAGIVGRQDAEDVVQLAYLRMLRFTPEKTNPVAWALQVAKNEAFRWRKDRSRHPLSDERQPEPSAPSAEIAAYETRDYVARSLQDIKPEWAEALRVYAETANLEAAAGRIGITVTALKKRMFQGRRALRRRT